MRTVWLVAAASIVMGAAGCAAKAKTKLWMEEDRIAINNALAKQKAGTLVTDRQLELADRDQTVICEDRKPVGSNIPVRRCATKRVLDEERQLYSERALMDQSSADMNKQDPKGYEPGHEPPGGGM